jgi:hypothetical protein
MCFLECLLLLLLVLIDLQEDGHDLIKKASSSAQGSDASRLAMRK